MNDSPAHLLEGVFFLHGDSVLCENASGREDLTELLQVMSDQQVIFSCSHVPPDPPLPMPGFGSCLWGNTCPCGHKEDPEWLWEFHEEGLLEAAGGNLFLLSGEPLDLSPLIGHRSRVLIVRKMHSEGSEDKSIGEVSDLTNLIEAFRKHVRDLV